MAQAMRGHELIVVRRADGRLDCACSCMEWAKILIFEDTADHLHREHLGKEDWDA